MFKARYSSKGKSRLDVEALKWLVKNPALENKVISEKIGCHRKGLEKALARINNSLPEFLEDNPELFNLLCAAYRGEFLKFLAGSLEEKEIAVLLPYLEAMSVVLRTGSQSLVDLSAQDINSVLQLRLKEGKSYKEISKVIGWSEVTVQRFSRP